MKAPVKHPAAWWLCLGAFDALERVQDFDRVGGGVVGRVPMPKRSRRPDLCTVRSGLVRVPAQIGPRRTR
jgi:hypothetical protein